MKGHRNLSRSNIYNYLFIDMREDLAIKLLNLLVFKEHIKNSIRICIQSLCVYRLDRITNAKIFLALLIYAKYIQVLKYENRFRTKIIR